MRRIHLIAGILGVIAFVLSGQVMARHHPHLEELSAELHMMYVSRHIYLLAGSLVNVAIGLYLHAQTASWRRAMQAVGSVLILLSPVVLAMAFLYEPALGLAGHSWRTYFGMIGLFAGVMTHLIANLGAGRRADSGQA